MRRDKSEKAEEAPEVVDTATAVADAEANLTAAKTAHAEAVEAHRIATTPVPVKGKHVMVEGTDGAHALADAPEGYDADAPAREITLGGATYHHVADHASGVWIYRKV